MQDYDKLREKRFGLVEDFTAELLGADAVPFGYIDSNPEHLISLDIAACEEGAFKSYDAGDDKWFDVDDFSACASLSRELALHIYFPLVENEGWGMDFKVEHPREVAELFQIVLKPASLTGSMGGPAASTEHLLGDLYDFRIVLPCARTWRMLDPAALPAEAGEDFRQTLSDSFAFFVCGSCIPGDTIAASEFQSRWKDLLEELPAGEDGLKAGYFFDGAGRFTSAADLLAVDPGTKRTRLDLLLLPRRSDVSCLYLRELIASDRDIIGRIDAALAASDSMDDAVRRLKTVAVELPSDYFAQVRMAAEYNAGREWLRYAVDGFDARPSSFEAKRLANLTLARRIFEME